MAHFQAKQHGKVSLSVALIVPFVLQIICIVGLMVYACYRSGQTIENTGITLLLAGLCVILFNIILAIMIARRITQPIKQLAQAIAAGQYPLAVHKELLDKQIIAEVDLLIHVFTQQIASLKTMIATLDDNVANHATELQRLTEQLQLTQQAKSDLISKINHDLRSSLNAVLGFSELLINAKNIPDEYHDSLHIIYSSGQHLLALLNGFVTEGKQHEPVVNLPNEKTVELTLQHFQVMPTEWLSQLLNTLLEADKNQLLQLIQEIPPTEIFLIQQLTELVNKFQFEYLFNLIEPLIIPPDNNYFTHHD
jgi:signal transduction histidine kinase